MKFRFLIGSFLGASVALAAYFYTTTQKDSSTYSPKSLTALDAQSNGNDAAAWYKAQFVNRETGQPYTDEEIIEMRKNIRRLPSNKSIAFMDYGPDNIGGRTRAIQVDRTWNDRIWAGGVSGGLFVSFNGANSWTRVTSYEDAGASPNISSMTQTIDGTLYVATGSNQEGSGNGVWYSQNFGESWTKIPGTTNCTEIESSDVDNYAWLATSTGLKKFDVNENVLTSIGTGQSGGVNALKITKDGTIVIANISNLTFVSKDGGESFENKSSNNPNDNLVGSSASRIEYTVSASENSSGMHSLYAVLTNSNLVGMYVSHDDGDTWTKFVGASAPPNEFDIYRNQGTYNSIVSTNPLDAEEIYIGGIDIWRWKQTVNNPPSGGFEKVSQWFVNPTSSIYVHADNHEMKWDANNRLYIGNDGGVNITNDFADNWYPANRGYNVTQFYGIAYDRNGAVMGGAQDNGTLYSDHSLSTFQEFVEVSGGDGFQCEISHYNPNVAFATVQYGAIRRTGDGWATANGFVPDYPSSYDPVGDAGAQHPFHTRIFLAEYFDENSEDSVMFIPTKNYNAGDVMSVPSLASGDTIYVTATQDYYFTDTLYYTPAVSNDSVNFGVNPVTGELHAMGADTVDFNVAWDTLTVQDPFQSWFLVYTQANGGELWGTRNALRLSVSDVNWVNVARSIGSGGADVEFSRNLEHCYISAGNGIWRLDGLGSVYTSDTAFVDKVAFYSSGGNDFTPTYTQITKINNAAASGIAVNPNNADDLVMFGGNVRRTSNATAASPNFTNLSAVGVPCTDGIIDRNDPNIIVAGTLMGAVVSDNGGSSWTNVSAGFEGTVVTEVLQSWRTAEEGNGRPGEIYLGTYGRGIWASGDYLSVGIDEQSIDEPELDMTIYPNPVQNEFSISFDMMHTGDVAVNVYSLSGAKLKTYEFPNVVSGSQNLDIDVSSLNRGTFLVQLVTEHQKHVKKIMKL
ncbi:MAG: T9SS type A sorting domain-containing protein [Crocinitomicaceae bacterium]|nr:T9SS type A sorting domain-containing protein [Crocinitomicaceae bacterium]